MKVTYTFNVPSTIGPEKIKASLEAHSDSKINEMLAMHIGACADYTVTVATSPVTTMGNTMDSAGNQVTASTASTASPATTGGSEAAATGSPDTSDARSESIMVMAVMATAAVTLA